jgi:hypothetical protein
MKKIILPAITLFFITSCNDSKQEQPTTSANPDTDTVSAKTEKPAPVYAFPVKYKDWEIGDPVNIKTTLDVYKAWDDKQPEKLSALFADTVRLRIPDEREEIAIPNNKIAQQLGKNRNMYDSTYNNILSAVSLHDKESGEDWVLITTYNKWIEKNGKRDSVLYNDNWRLKNGKLDLLMSYYKLPTKEFLKRNDSK